MWTVLPSITTTINTPLLNPPTNTFHRCSNGYSLTPVLHMLLSLLHHYSPRYVTHLMSTLSLLQPGFITNLCLLYNYSNIIQSLLHHYTIAPSQLHHSNTALSLLYHYSITTLLLLYYSFSRTPTLLHDYLITSALPYP